MAQLTWIEWSLGALGAGTLLYDAVAIRRVCTSSFYSPAQRWAQAALILFLPIIGAYIALYMARENVPLFQTPPVDHVQDIDPTCSDFDYRE
ncbi:MAG: hypothetical protein V4476_08375 [Pseudomonadota bacterium]